MTQRFSIRMWKNALFIGFFIAILGIAGIAEAAPCPPCEQGSFCNPICSKSLEELIGAISAGVLKVALVLAPLAVLIAGFRFLIAASRGDQAGLSKARQLFMWTLIGTAILVGASVIATAVINFAKGL